MFSETTALQKIRNLKKRVRIVQGGTSASKTISILLYLIGYAQTDKTATLTSVVSESVPHLKRGVIRDFKRYSVNTVIGKKKDGTLQIVYIRLRLAHR